MTSRIENVMAAGVKRRLNMAQLRSGHHRRDSKCGSQTKERRRHRSEQAKRCPNYPDYRCRTTRRRYGDVESFEPERVEDRCGRRGQVAEFMNDRIRRAIIAGRNAALPERTHWLSNNLMRGFILYTVLKNSIFLRTGAAP
jgi:hypothetical protein